MKKIIVMTLMSVIICTGCGKKELTPAEKSNAARIEDFNQRFIFVDSGLRVLIIDKETGVQYLWVDGDIQVIVDRNGLPHIADGWRDYD